MRVKGMLTFISILTYAQVDASQHDDTGDAIHDDVYFLDSLKRFRIANPKNLITCHLNVNGLSDLMSKGYADILFISETKLDESFPAAQFTVPDFKIHRADRNGHGGGVMAFLRSDIPHRRRADLEALVTKPVESIVIEAIVRRDKWLFVCVYSPHSKHKLVCCNSIGNILISAYKEFSTVFVLGDMNINMLSHADSKCLQDVMDVYDLKNLIHEPTCFKSKTGTCLDLILTESCRRVSGTININTGVSDFHHLVGFSTKLQLPRVKKSKIIYRTYKKFDETLFKSDMDMAPFHVGDIFDDITDVCWFMQSLLCNVIESHAPLKQRKPVKMPVPFMNSELRKACHKRAMSQNRYFKMGRTNNLWESYRKHRNYVRKCRAISVKHYFEERCHGKRNGNPKIFWKTIKPFLTDKSTSNDACINILKDGEIINDPARVCNDFNDFFCNVAADIGSEKNLSVGDSIETIVNSFHDHNSIKVITRQNLNIKDFSFKEVSTEQVYSLLSKLDAHKAPGYDNIPSKLLCVAAYELCTPITSLVNLSIRQSEFPDQLKRAEVSPIYKSKDNLQRGNYRPVSILTSISKIFERVYHDQLYEYFNGILSVLLAAFRKNYSCQHVLTKLVEDSKAALDRHENVGLIFIDLSKAFDSLPHRLLLSKLYSYGVSLNACELLHSYMCERKQRVKMGANRSDWAAVNKGVPQGSILGPLLFNIFINDLLYIIDKCWLYNYADDNTIGKSNKNMNVLQLNLEEGANQALQWFDENGLATNTSKFHALSMTCKEGEQELKICLSGVEIPTEDSVKTLGIYLDKRLKFDKHVSIVCQKASRQINAMSRISKYLDVKTKTMMYNAFVMSNFTYCINVWHFGQQSNAYKLEKLQKRALRVILNDFSSSYPQLLKAAGRSSVYVVGLRIVLTEFYKYLHGISPAFLDEMIIRNNHAYNTRNSQCVLQPKVNTVTFGLNSFRYQGPKLWNDLPNSLKDAASLQEFKTNISKWSGPKCSCGFCILCKMYSI